MILTQITTAQDTATIANQTDTVSILDLLLQGGFMMVPIFILSAMAVYIFTERVLNINKAAKTPDDFMSGIRNRVEQGDIDGAKVLCTQYDSPTARMIEKGISRIGSPLKNIEVSIENVGKIEIFKLEKNLALLATISGAAPMLGFLGTVIGMIQSFIAIAQEEGSVSPKLLSEGIYTAMVTTAAGLFVGILAYIGYNYLVSRVQKVVHKMEYNSVDFIDLLQEPR
ncbi:MotA/TolQ/ExbB proton channel family protein [Fulvivirga sp. RKSG066]|uniref:MotA/TolQ/ExbB proton channel family protein n=1 Tax=Fulvivirga aurantia TaxID=2529383 RepID=UPI0012BD1910|nr:MotA/TolQ/ExbB proton channel family protein [Fulvivirga aurantia]MTI20575.1 MotA/TolQ/ExbB proton channel family protein [Fulvivirga aurantia]